MIDKPENFNGLSCTIVTTEDCNLRCKYCYENHRTPKTVDVDKAKRFVDMVVGLDPKSLLANSTILDSISDGISFDFIGGDALINPQLLDTLMRYINVRVAGEMVKGKFPSGWRGSISTNGTLFARKDVRDFCEKWASLLSVGVSIDGCPEIHDMNRVYRDGRGSMADILKWWKWYQGVFGDGARVTKSTMSRNSIPYVYDSVRYMYEVMGIKWQMMNFIMEDTHADASDYAELDRQLEKACAYVLDHRHEMYCRLFDSSQLPDALDNRDANHQFSNSGWCGSGFMPTMNINGDIYSCFRWCPLSQNGSDHMKVGNVDSEDLDVPLMKRIQKNAFRCNCSKDPKCRDCEYEPVCSYCIAGGYSEFGDFVRPTYICEYTKLLCKWAKTYWDEYDRLEGTHGGK